jgi:hypothetical protein
LAEKSEESGTYLAIRFSRISLVGECFSNSTFAKLPRRQTEGLISMGRAIFSRYEKKMSWREKNQILRNMFNDPIVMFLLFCVDRPDALVKAIQADLAIFAHQVAQYPNQV